MKTLYKTILVILSEYDPTTTDASDLVREGEIGSSAYIVSQDAEQKSIEELRADASFDDSGWEEFFGVDEESAERSE